MRADRAEDADGRPAATADACGTRGADAESDRTSLDRADTSDRTERAAEYRATVENAYRAHAIDQGCARVEKIEETIVTPAMRRIEAEDPHRHLAGFDNRLKEKDRLAEKVLNYLKSNSELSADQALAKIKDSIRYTFQYAYDQYTEGVLTDIERLKGRFEVVDVRNTWDDAEYKGVNSRWRVPENGQLFEVQFHTQASLEAKESTHWAYEKIRNPDTPKEERSELQDFQRRVSAAIPVPRNVADIPDFP
jgi:hypothetical protein